MHTSGSSEHDRASGEDLAPEDLLAHANPLRRLAIAGLVVIVALPVVPISYIAAWVGLYLAVVIGEQVVVARADPARRKALHLPVTFALSVLNALAAAVLIKVGDGGGRFFAVALMGFSSVNILLRFYSSPRLFLAAVSPHAAVLLMVCWGAFQTHLAAGHLLKALTPVAVVVTYALLMMPTRAGLAQAWRKLVRAKAEAEAASLAKSDFLATMSHEIRTPLNGILGMAQAMQRADLPREQKARLRVIRQSGEGLLCLLNDALDFSQIEAGTLAIEPREFDMEHLTRGAVATFTPLAQRKGLSFEFSIDEAAKGTFVGDGLRIRQILYNLAANAVKFTEIGGVWVWVSHADGVLKLEVADSGVGIAPERIETLFGQFVQGDASATRRHGGAGLGLAISRSLAELMGGRVQVSSIEDKGSLFTVSLPMERLAAPTAMAEPAAAAAPAEAARPIRILAAEDNAVNQLVLKTLLSQAGLEPTVVENGAEAIEAWKTGRWDVILMDIQMPVMDGVTAAREIRACEAADDRARTPIIAVTANAMSHQVADYEAAGIDAVVPKPLDAARLFEAIEQALKTAEPDAAAAAA